MGKVLTLRKNILSMSFWFFFNVHTLPTEINLSPMKHSGQNCYRFLLPDVEDEILKMFSSTFLGLDQKAHYLIFS